MQRRVIFAFAGGCIVVALGLGWFLLRGEPSPASVIDAYLAAWNRHDADAAAAYLGPAVIYFDAAVGTSLVGRSEVKTQVIENYMHAAPDSVWALTEPPLMQGKTVFFQWRFSGTNTGEWQNGTPATQMPFSFEGRSSADIVDGLIVREVDYYDPTAIFRAAGK